MSATAQAPRPATREERPAMRAPKLAAETAALALLDALAGAADPVAAVVTACADLVTAPCAALWRRDGSGRLLLAYRHGDAAPEHRAEAGPGVAADDDTGSAAPGIPLELPAPPEGVGVVHLQGLPFAALALAAGVLALGPLPGPALARRDPERLEVLRRVAAGAIDEAVRRANLESELDGLRREVEMSRRAVGGTVDEGRAFGLLLDLAVTSGGAQGGFVAIRARDEERFRIAASRDLPEAFAALDVTPGAGVLAEIPGLPGILVVEDPLALLDAGVTGLLAVAGPEDAERPSLVFGLAATGEATLPDDAGLLLATLVEQAALVQQSAEAAQAASDRHLEALRGMCRALDARSPGQRPHHETVATAADAIARTLGIDDEERRVIREAALVHDVGLLAAGADDALAAEFAHPTLGAEMTALVPGAAELAPVIRAHHEWWDGFGFPAGIAGESIPRGARVLGAAEFYVEVLESGHPSRPEDLIEEVRARSGTQLDPACADAIVRLIQERA